MAAPSSQVGPKKSDPSHQTDLCQCDPAHRRCNPPETERSSLTSAADSPSLLPPPPLLETRPVPAASRALAPDEEEPLILPSSSNPPAPAPTLIGSSSSIAQLKKTKKIQDAATLLEPDPNAEEPLIPPSSSSTPPQAPALPRRSSSIAEPKEAKEVKDPPKPFGFDPKAEYGDLDRASRDLWDEEVHVTQPSSHTDPLTRRKKKSSRKEKSNPEGLQTAASTPAKTPMASQITSRSSSPQLAPSPSLAAEPDPAQPKKTQPSLEEEAKLSLGTQLADWGYRSFWWGVSLPQRFLWWGGNKVMQKVTSSVINAAAHKGVELLAPPDPETPLRFLRNCLSEISEKVSTDVAIDPSLRSRSIHAVSDFLALQTTYLNESINPYGLKEGLTFHQVKQFQVLLEALKANRPLTTTFVKPLYEFIEKCWGYQQQFYIGKKAQQLQGQVLQPTTALAAAQPTVEIVEIRELPSVPAGAQIGKEKKELPPPPLPEPAEKPPKQNPIPVIINEIDQLKSLGFKIALALFILPESRLQQREGESGSLIADLIKKANETLDPLKDSNEIFQGFIFNELDFADLNFFQRTWKKLTCKLLAPLILFMIDHVLEQSKETLLYLIGLPPEERMNMIIKVFIEPSSEFIGKLHAEYIALAKNPEPGTTVDRAIGDAITNIKIKDRQGKELTPKDLINRLVGALIHQFAPAFNWTSVAMTHFKTQAAQTKGPLQFFWVVLSFLSWVVNIISGPFQWGLHQVVRQIVKMVVVSSIHAKLQDTKEGSWDFGKLALQSLYKTLYTKLYKLNRTKPGSTTDHDQKKRVIEQAAFVDKNVQSNIHQLLAGFYKVLSFQGCDLIDLHKKFGPHSGLKQTVDEGMDWVINQALDKATEGIIQGLQNSLADESFSSVLSEIFVDIRQQCQNFNTSKDEGNFNRLETDFFVELQGAIERGLNAAIDEDPSKRMQEEADLFIDGVKHDIATFQEQWSLLTDLTPAQMDKLKKERDKYLLDGLEQRRKRAQAQTQASLSAQGHVGAVVSGFSALRAPIYESIDRLISQTQGLRKIEDQKEELTQLDGRLEKALRKEPLEHATKFYHELQVTLQLIRNKTYSPKVQALISNLQGNFDTWTNEILKRENQTLINSSILALRDAIKDSRAGLEAEAATLKAARTKTHQETEQALNVLIEWSEKLHHFICSAPQQKMSLLKEFFSRYAQGQLPSIILKQLQTFFIFLGKNHNVKGLLWFVVKSYLELPTKSPQKLKEIIDKVKLELEEPLTEEIPPQ